MLLCGIFDDLVNQCFGHTEMFPGDSDDCLHSDDSCDGVTSLCGIPHLTDDQDDLTQGRRNVTASTRPLPLPRSAKFLSICYSYQV